MPGQRVARVRPRTTPSWEHADGTAGGGKRLAPRLNGIDNHVTLHAGSPKIVSCGIDNTAVRG
ncbi:hypothetical protein B1790_28305 [Mycobacterium sp. AT1]|nr:hypothetical protein B1790_28305 [Mycobacterium sp. AT1]